MDRQEQRYQTELDNGDTLVAERNSNYEPSNKKANWFLVLERNGQQFPPCLGGIDYRDGLYDVGLCLYCLVDPDGDVDDPDNWSDYMIVGSVNTVEEAVDLLRESGKSNFSNLARDHNLSSWDGYSGSLVSLASCKSK